MVTQAYAGDHRLQSKLNAICGQLTENKRGTTTEIYPQKSR